MQLVPTRVGALAEEAWLASQELESGGLVGTLRLHLTPEQVSDQARYARVLLRGPNSSPTEDILLGGDGEVGHGGSTGLV
jgi:hypothetical protein